MEAIRTFEDGLFEPQTSHPASPGAELITMDLRELLERQHHELLRRFDLQDELLKQPVRGSNLSVLPMPKRQSSAPSPTRLPGISETEIGNYLKDMVKEPGSSPMHSKEYGYESPLGSKYGDSKKRSKEYACDSPLGSKDGGDKKRTTSPAASPRSIPKSRLPKSFRPAFETFTQADMALRNIAAKVDTERMKKRYEMTSVNSRSSDGGPRHVLRQCVKSPAFDSFFALLVLTNTIFIGIEVQQTLHQEYPPPGYVIIQYIYTGFFTLELILRAAAGGYAFFCGRDWAWSWLDVIVVISSMAEIVFDILAATGVAHTSGFRALRVVRITRFLKTLRLVRVFRFILSLRTLITSILYTLKSLFWALVLLMLIIYLFSVLLAQAVCEYRVTPDFDLLPQRAKDSVDRYYTSLPKMMLSLFMAICGGVSWEDVLEPLEHISLVWVFIFLFYIQFTYFAVLNVLTGVFCQSAVESAQNDHANVVQSMLANKEAHVEKIRALFSKLGADEEGHITYAMFEEGLTSPAVVQYFETLGLDVWDAWSFFKLLDLDSGGSVEVEEFFKGCLRFRGQARGVDVGKILHDQAWLIKSQGQFQTFMEMKMRRVNEMLAAIAGIPVDESEDGFLTSGGHGIDSAELSSMKNI